MNVRKAWFRTPALREAAIFIAMFAMTMVQQWLQLDTFMNFLKGLTFFMILYLQAQLHRFFVFPLFTGQRYIKYSIAGIILSVLGASLLFACDYYWIDKDFYQSKDFDFIRSIIYFIAICIVSTITITSLLLISQHTQELQKRTQDQIHLSEMKIKFLNAQLNPHFLFNTLNNVYGVSLTDPGRVPELILQLSSMLRYQIDNGQKTYVTIRDEIKFIENYITMERERLSKRCDIELKIRNEYQYELEQYRIAPLILITLVENAFKHSTTISEKWFIKILVEITATQFQIRIWNSIADPSLTNHGSGMGLANIRNRLDILYPGTYRFDTKSTENEFETNLVMKLESLKK